MTTLFIILAICILLGVLYFSYVPSRKSPGIALWEKLPTKDEYKKAHPDAAANESQLHCYHCNSQEVLDVGVARSTDFRRTMICKKCKRQLWREED